MEIIKKEEKERKEWAKKLLKGIEETKERARRDKRSTSAYWNGDEWGSLSGVRDAEEWTENQVLDFILKNARPK